MATVLYYDSEGDPEFLCSGTLVSSNVVLTAGHCGADESTSVPNSPSGYRIVTNAVDWTDTTNAQVSEVSQVVVDPNFDPATLYGDASMLVLASPVTEPTIPLWASGEFDAGTQGTIAGWGKTYSAQPSWQTVLQWAPTVLQNVDYCSNEAEALDYDYDSGSELCVVDFPYDETATCNGDSGGPLIADDTQGDPIEIGITSVVPTDCDTTTADFFTAVLPIEPWIESEISAAAPTPTTTTPVTTTPTTTTTPSTTTPSTTTPTTQTPSKPELRRMTAGAARSFTRTVLAGVFHRTFTRGNSYTVSCSRLAASRMNCIATFSSGPNDYYGNVVVYYEFGAKDVVYWTDYYTMRWVNDYCYFHSGHRRTCKIKVRHGTY